MPALEEFRKFFKTSLTMRVQPCSHWSISFTSQRS